MDRLKKLLAFEKENPQDPFLIYGIALEYVMHDEHLAKKYFNTLLNEHPDYLPTYYKAAEFFNEQDESEKVKAIYVKGIELAEKQQDQKAIEELKQAYKQFLEWEEL